MKVNYVLLIASTIVVGYLILDVVFDDPMWHLSTQLTIKMQEREFHGEVFMFNFFTYIVFLPPMIAFISFVVLDCKLNVLLYMSLCVGSACFNELAKNVYHQPRPYMVESTISRYTCVLIISSSKCDTDYGKPSGHSQNSLVMVFMMPLLIFPGLYNLKRYTNHPNLDPILDNNARTGYTIDSFKEWEGKRSEQYSLIEHMIPQSYQVIVLKSLIIFLMCCSVIMTGLSRIFEGVHSIGQVLLGWVFGIYLITIFITVIRQPIRQQLIIQIIFRHCISIFDSFKSGNKQYQQVIPIAFMMLIFLITLSGLLLLLNLNFFVSSVDVETWVVAINSCLKNAPGTLTASSPLVLYNACFSLTFTGAVVTGLLVGGFVTRGSYKEGQFYKDFLRSSTTSIMLRFIILFGMYSILIPFVFIKTENIYIQAFCQILPASFLVGFLLNFAYPQLCHKFNLQIPGDIFYLKIYNQENRLLNQEYDNVMSLETGKEFNQDV